MTDEEQDMETTQALTTIQGGDSDQMLFDPRSFEHAQRVATMFSKSQLVPAHLQNRPADCFLALHMAHRMGEDPLMVAQNIVIIQGTAGWKAQWLIARANRTGALTGRIKYRTERLGDPIQTTRRIKDANKNWQTVDCEVPNIAVTAYAKDEDGDEVSYRVSMQDAIAEGWTQNPKYSSIGELMLSYRAASFLIRLNCPEVTLGYQTAEELEDMSASGRLKDVSPSTGDHSATDALRDLQPATDVGGEESPVTEDDSDSQEGVLDDPEATGDTDPPQEQAGQAVDAEANGVPLVDGAGNNLGGYQRQGSWLNALIKLVTEAQADPKAAHAILHANAETIERIRAGGAYGEKLGQLDAMMQAIGDPAGEDDEQGESTDDWIGAYDSASDDDKTDHDLYAELTDDLDSLVAAQDTGRIRDRLDRADDITDSAVRADAENELNGALRRAQP